MKMPDDTLCDSTTCQYQRHKLADSAITHLTNVHSRNPSLYAFLVTATKAHIIREGERNRKKKAGNI